MAKEVDFVSLNTNREQESAIVRLLTITDGFCDGVTETLAKIYASGRVKLIRMSSGSKSRSFELSSSEVSSLIEALQAFQQKRDEARQAEQAQLEADLAEAKALVKSVKTELDDLRIIVSKHEQNPEIYAFRVPAFGIQRTYIHESQVLETVKSIIEQIESEIVYLESVDHGEKSQSLIVAWRNVRPLPVENEETSYPEQEMDEMQELLRNSQ